MIKTISLALLAGGVLYLVVGNTASDALSSDASRFFTGAAIDGGTWKFVGGVVGTAIGLVGLFRTLRKS